MVNIGEFIRKYSEFNIIDAEGNTKTKQIINDFLVLAAENGTLELHSYKGTPPEGSIIHEESEIKESYELVYLPDKEVECMVVYKDSIRVNIPCKIAVALRYMWHGKSVDFPYQVYVNTPNGRIKLT